MDADGDGTGDFVGLVRRLDHLVDLGVTCLWLMPFYPTAERDDGYDITDFYGVDPRLGDHGDVVELVRAARDRGHAGHRRPGRQPHLGRPPVVPGRARGSRQPVPGLLRVALGPPAGHVRRRSSSPTRSPGIWTLDEPSGQWYLHRFYAHQPDLNVANPAVRAEILKVVGFWLELGISGFRMDAVPFLLETDGLSVDELEAFPEPHDFLREVRRFVASRRGDAILLGEVNLPFEEQLRFFGGAEGDELDMQFDFIGMQRMYLSLARGDAQPIITAIKERPGLADRSQWATFVRNHDELTLDKLGRLRAAGGVRRLRAGAGAPAVRPRASGAGCPRCSTGTSAASGWSTRCSSPCPARRCCSTARRSGWARTSPPGTRQAVRTPMQWSDGPNGGFSTAAPELLPNPVVTGAFGPRDGQRGLPGGPAGLAAHVRVPPRPPLPAVARSWAGARPRSWTCRSGTCWPTSCGTAARRCWPCTTSPTPRARCRCPSPGRAHCGRLVDLLGPGGVDLDDDGAAVVPLEGYGLPLAAAGHPGRPPAELTGSVVRGGHGPVAAAGRRARGVSSRGPSGSLGRSPSAAPDELGLGHRTSGPGPRAGAPGPAGAPWWRSRRRRRGRAVGARAARGLGVRGARAPAFLGLPVVADLLVGVLDRGPGDPAGAGVVVVGPLGGVERLGPRLLGLGVAALQGARQLALPGPAGLRRLGHGRLRRRRRSCGRVPLAGVCRASSSVGWSSATPWSGGVMPRPVSTSATASADTGEAPWARTSAPPAGTAVASDGQPRSTRTASGRAASTSASQARVPGARCVSRAATTSGRPAAAARTGAGAGLRVRVEGVHAGRTARQRVGQAPRDRPDRGVGALHHPDHQGPGEVGDGALDADRRPGGAGRARATSSSTASSIRPSVPPSVRPPTRDPRRGRRPWRGPRGGPRRPRPRPGPGWPPPPAGPEGACRAGRRDDGVDDRVHPARSQSAPRHSRSAPGQQRGDGGGLDRAVRVRAAHPGHVQGVGDEDAVEAQPVPQQGGDRRARRGGAGRVERGQERRGRSSPPRRLRGHRRGERDQLAGRASRSASARTTGAARWESSTVSPWPGKCLTQAATPASASPCTAATPWRATRSGSAP